MKTAGILASALLLGALGACKRRPPTNPLTLLTPLFTPSATLGPYLSPTQSATATESATPTSSATVSDTLTLSPTPPDSETQTPTFSESDTLTPSSTRTESASGTPTATESASFSATRTGTPTPTRTPVSFAAHVQPIFNGNCTSCHGANGGLTLSSPSSYLELADVPAESSCVGQPRVNKVSSDPDTSVLVFKVSGFSCGSQMGSLSAGQVQVIRDWISQGALNN